MNQKTFILFGILSSSFLLVKAANVPAQTQDATQKTAQVEKGFSEEDAAKFMEVIGYNIGQSFPLDDMQLSPKATEAFIKGLSDSIHKVKCTYDVEKIMPEAQAFMMEKMKIVEEKNKEKMKIQEEKMKAEAIESHKTNEAFIAKLKADNKKVVETAEGLVYEIVAEGKGLKPTDQDTVKVHYRGTLIDGTEFDSSYKTNTPATFVSGEVIEGFRKGVQLISKGGKVKLYLRPKLGYGDQFRLPSVPNARAGSLLIFDIELIDIQSPAKKDLPAAPNTSEAKPQGQKK